MPKSLLLAALVAVAAANHSVLAQEDKTPKSNWTGSGDGKSWSQGSNWSTGHPPTSAEIVGISGAEVRVHGANNEASLLKCSATTLVVEAGAELHIMGGGNHISTMTKDSEIRVHGTLLLNTALGLEQSKITVDGNGLIDREGKKGSASVSPFALNLVGDKAQIKNLARFGSLSNKPGEMNVDITLGPNGVEAIDAYALILKEMSILTVDVSKYKPAASGASVTLFSCKKLNGQFETVNITGGTAKIQYGERDVTLADIVVKP